jgi:2-keto-3-deoxy-L-rhamnonate aldolase RhmA
VGLPGQVSHPKVLEEVKRCNDLIQSYGIASGSMSTSVEYIKMLQEMGYNFIAYLNDAAAMRQHFMDTLKQVR